MENEFNLEEFQRQSMRYFDGKLSVWEVMKYTGKNVSKIKDISMMHTLLNDLAEDGKGIIVDVGKYANADSLGKVEKRDSNLDFYWNNELFVTIKPEEMIIHHHYIDTNYVALVAEQGKFTHRKFEPKDLENVIMIHPKGSIYTPPSNSNLRFAAMKNLIK